MMQILEESGSWQPYVTTEHVNQDNQPKQGTRDHIEVRKWHCYYHWDQHCMNWCQKMRILTTHSKGSTELFHTCGPSDPRLNNYRTQLVGAFGTEVVFWLARWVQDFKFRTTSVIAACNNPRTTWLRYNNGWSDFPSALKQDGIEVIIFSIVLIPHMLDMKITGYINMWQKDLQ